MKNQNLYKAIKITLIVLVIILIILAFLVGKNIIEEKNTPIYSTIESMPNVETLINQMYGKFIKMEDSKNEKYFKDIYVKLKYDLYENEKPKKDFYNSLITATAQIMRYENYRIIDENKNIELKVVCDTENQALIGTYINGDTNFYGHFESQKALANYKKTETTKFNIESIEINTLIQNDWNRDKLSIGKAENKADEYIQYAEYGINIYEIDEKVFNLLFDTRYTKPIVNGIKVGDTLEDVEKALGTATFGSIEEGYIGYKGEKLYIFFNKYDISIYPVADNSSNLSNLIEQYEKDGSIKKMVSNATDIWENYEEYYYDEYTVNLTYPLIGIKFQFGVTEDNGIIIYNNYEGKIFNNYTQEELRKLENQIEIPSYVYFVQEDSVNEYEKERYNFMRVTEDDEIDDSGDEWKYL